MLVKLPKAPSLLVQSFKLASTSDYGRFRLGAIITQGKRIVSYGVNSKKTHPLQAKYANRPHLDPWLHAEIHAISLANAGDLVGADAFVGRILQDDTPANSRPCAGCMRALRDYGIRRVTYMDDGKVIRELL